MWASLPSRSPPIHPPPTRSLNLSIVPLDRSFVPSFILSPLRPPQTQILLSMKPSPLQCMCAAVLRIPLLAISPGALVFQCDMFLDLPLVADLLTLTQHHQALIDCRLLRANARRIRHEYKVNDLVFLRIHAPDSKLSLVRSGPSPFFKSTRIIRSR